MKLNRFVVAQFLLCSLFFAPTALAQSSEFTYQGRLLDSSSPPTGLYEMEFRLYDTLVSGSQHGSTIQLLGVPVTNGVFTVRLDFGNQFSGAARFLEIAVRNTPGPFTLLAPRQPMTSTPYSVRSLNTGNADTLSAACVGCVSASQIGSVNGGTVTGTIPIASVPAGNGSYIQNQNAGVQPTSNFIVSGTGEAGMLRANTEYRLGTSRVLSAPGTQNFFVGKSAGVGNTTGQRNLFVGESAGLSNTTGVNNTFLGQFAGDSNLGGTENIFIGDSVGNFNSSGSRNTIVGTFAGLANVTGGDNSFFGFAAGQDNTASNNSFFGRSAGVATSTGGNNSYFGFFAGRTNTTGANNAFFGASAGRSNTTATGNSFFGYEAGLLNTTGANNAFFGASAGRSNTTATGNSFFGYEAGLLTTTGANNAFFGYATGQNNSIGSSNAFFGGMTGGANTTGGSNSFFGFNAGAFNTSGNNNVFVGRSAGLVNSTGNYNSFVGHNVGLNNTASNNSFLGASAGSGNTTGNNNSYVGFFAGTNNMTGSNNSYIGSSAGLISVGGGNAFFGASSGQSNIMGGNNTAIGFLADFNSSSLFHSTAIGSGTIAFASDQIQLGRNGTDTVRIGVLAAATSTNLCINASNVLAACTSSRIYKQNISPFMSGLDLIKRLRPVTYDWIESKEADLGLIAEEVAEIEPLLVTHNQKGEIQGVKYDQITLVLINAVKDQQAQIERQQKHIETLTRLVCTQNPDVQICRLDKQ